jgi:adenylosuccinate synthase
MDPGPIADEYLAYAEWLLPLVTDTSLLLWQAIQDEKEVIFEGAQGVLTGVGIGPKDIHRVVGIAKAYISRVGTGPFPTELSDEIGDQMVDIGGEYGTVTGRRRRCGWLDLVALRYAVRVNGLTDLFLTKLDVLSHFDTLKVAVGYTSLGERYDEFPRQQRVLYNCAPVYEEFQGWRTDITGARSYDDLPPEARTYIEFIEDSVGVPIRWVSVGPERSQLVERS